MKGKNETGAARKYIFLSVFPIGFFFGLLLQDSKVIHFARKNCTV